jgi:hypothetical protein
VADGGRRMAGGGRSADRSWQALANRARGATVGAQDREFSAIFSD